MLHFLIFEITFCIDQALLDGVGVQGDQLRGDAHRPRLRHQPCCRLDGKVPTMNGHVLHDTSVCTYITEHKDN